ncbi:MAG TPA: hypothetical protein VLX28_20460, partial [Thermoanaerobaculia bacterium]|nr:hypothetical protein [Thermoanaerobaculia bacterium]
MEAPPFAVHHDLDGWDLFWVHLEFIAGQEAGVAALRRESSARARTCFALDSISSDPTVAALRSLFRAAGCDPTRYRPSSEALLRRVLKGEDLPAIHPLVDLNNCLSVEL